MLVFSLPVFLPAHVPTLAVVYLKRLAYFPHFNKYPTSGKLVFGYVTPVLTDTYKIAVNRYESCALPLSYVGNSGFDIIKADSEGRFVSISSIFGGQMQAKCKWFLGSLFRALAFGRGVEHLVNFRPEGFVPCS